MTKLLNDTVITGFMCSLRCSFHFISTKTKHVEEQLSNQRKIEFYFNEKVVR